MVLNTLSILKRSFLFDTLSDKDVKIISELSSQQKVAKNQPLFLEGEPAQSFYMIVYGKLKIFKLSPSGKEHIIHLHAENDIVAEAAIFDRKSYPANCTAVEDSLVIKIPKKEFIELVYKDPSIAIKFMSAYSKRLREFVSVIEELSGSDVRKRLARYVINNARPRNNVHVLKLDISKKELASMLGTVPETISRSIAGLVKLKLISVKERDIVVLNPVKLKAFIQN